MFKVTALLKRKANTTTSDFRQYYENEHSAIVRENMPQLRRYQRNYLTKIDVEAYGIDKDQQFDCITYSWFDSEQAFLEISSQAAARIAEDEDKFLDRSKSRSFRTDTVESPSFLLPGEASLPRKKDMWKLLFTLSRKPGLTLEQMKAHYENSHVPMAHKYAPELRYYIRNYLNPLHQPEQPQVCDCITESWYSSLEIFQEMGARLSKNGGREEFSSDEAAFLDRSKIRWFEVVECES